MKRESIVCCVALCVGFFCWVFLLRKSWNGVYSVGTSQINADIVNIQASQSEVIQSRILLENNGLPSFRARRETVVSRTMSMTATLNVATTSNEISKYRSWSSPNPTLRQEHTDRRMHSSVTGTDVSVSLPSPITVMATSTSTPAPLPLVDVPLGDFPGRIAQHVHSVDDIVFIYRFYTEHNLSFAHSGGETKTLTSLSANSPEVLLPLAKDVPLIAWARSWFKQNYFVQKPGFASSFGTLGKQINKIRAAGVFGNNINAIRYHTYVSPCKMIKSLGNPAVLPVPVMLTFRLDSLDAGHFSGDVAGKTCVRRTNAGAAGGRKTTGDDVAGCDVVSGVLPDLERCNLSVESLYDVLNSSKILLLVTHQQQSITHQKLLSLPLGVEPYMAKEIMHFYKKQSFPQERPLLVAISNFFGKYSSTVIAHFSRFFHISASFFYDSLNDLDPIFLPEYLEKLSMSKFVLCPPSNLAYDSHRIWQALMMGAIPIVEASNPYGPGLEKSFSMLPVLVVPDLLQLKPNHLLDAYECFKNHTNQWRFDQLTQRHWDEMLLGALGTGSISHILADHPEYNPFCNFYLYNATGRWN